MFGAQPSSTPAFGTPSTPSFSTPSLFTTPFSQQQQQQTPSLFQTPQPQQQQTQSLFQTPQPQQQQNPSLFQTPQPQQQSSFGFATPSFNAATQSQFNTFNAPSATPFANQQLTTQMAPVAPLSLSLADRDIQAIVEAYKEEPANPKYAFKHLLFSVTEPQYRIKPAGVSDIMWAEAMGKLEGMEGSKRERLWPQLVLGFKDLSQRLKIMRIIEALEGKGSRLPLMKGEAELAEKLAVITRQLKGSGAELSRRVQNLLTLSRLQADGLNGGSVYLPGSTKIHEQSLADMQEVLQQQTDAVAKLGNVLKRDMRDMEIIMAEDTEMIEN
ncbi:hypothetical protein RD792_008740 [Penstemon davidsonii]|uniref:Nucleoporin Nup54 alpha-helical domain-containing protein n=1 Tax=Penstemon davidsonii TaxID=160366 RepID=A0ABR0DAK1_9LAMI|nr:hypothetical protein RD792_008740 [Penstemon davidsonii]